MVGGGVKKNSIYLLIFCATPIIKCPIDDIPSAPPVSPGEPVWLYQFRGN